ncbi:MAG TPA: [protein-PII] uridylyltransferase [Alphaproteobacteria bacterium]|nr:[protein-PII] uridylyltransferase [Alphaproteobacteria bacterium]
MTADAAHILEEVTIPEPPAKGRARTPASAAVAKLATHLAALAAEAKPSELRPQALKLLRETMEAGRADVRRRFYEDSASGADIVAANAKLMDGIIAAILAFAARVIYPVANPTKGEKLAVCAVGGYGRGELAPQSDIDLLFLVPYKKTPHGEQVIEYALYLLWDLGLKVGQAIRSVDECMRQAKADITIRTALLEARHLWGDAALSEELRKRFRKEVVAGSEADFVEAKLAERDARHQRVGDSRYVLEPNVKEGKGGLRDLHTLFWLIKYIYGTDDIATIVKRGILSAREAQRFQRAQNFLWTVRCHLHYLTNRPEERLTFDMQGEIGRLMGYRDHAGARGVERFMKHYFLVAKEVGDLTRIVCANLEDNHKRKPRSFLPFWGGKGESAEMLEGFKVLGGRIDVANDEAFAEDPTRLIGLFHTAQRHKLDIHPHALQLITRSLPLIDDELRNDAEANRLFMEILAAPDNSEFMLRRMNEAGVFGRFVPDFGRVVAQMQHDMYHVYTVDEHTIFAIGMMHRIEMGELKDELPLATEVFHRVQSRRALYLSILLHDIAKGRGGDHSELGADIALKLGPRLGLDEEETETVAWLVRFHLAMSKVAFKRDINDPSAIRAFVDVVQSPERLRLLLLLTVVDIRAVGPSVWNGWKAALLRDLFYNAREMMSGGLMTEGRAARVAAAKDALRAALPDWSEEEFAEHIARGYPSYWLAFDDKGHAHHARLIREAELEETPLAIDVVADSYRAVTEVTIYTADHPGLFARIAGAMAMSGANIVDARVFTLANGMALDSFWIQDVEGGAFEKADRVRKLRATIEGVLAGKIRPGRELAGKRSGPTRARAFQVLPRVLIDNAASATHTVIELNGRDRPGFLFDVTTAIADMALQISSAKISTYGARAVDVFYVKDLFGLKVTHEAKLAQLRERLFAAVRDPDEALAAAPTAKA